MPLELKSLSSAPAVGGATPEEPDDPLRARVAPRGADRRKALWAAAGWLAGFAAFALVIVLNKDLHTFLAYLLLGIPLGAMIALIAVGYSMVYGIIQLINFAHGDLFMMSAFFILMLSAPPDPSHGASPVLVGSLIGLVTGCAAWVVSERWLSRPPRAVVALIVGVLAAALNGRLMPVANATPVLPFAAAFLLSVVYACCLGVTMDLVAYRPLRHSPRLIPLITAIGLSFLFQNYAQMAWGPASRFFPAEARPHWLSGPQVELGMGLAVARLDLVIVALALVLMLGLHLFVMHTRIGRAMRACAQDRVTASLMGVETNRVVAVTFAIGAALAAAVAPLYVMRWNPMYPQMGNIVGILAFASAVLGGIGNMTGAMLGGLIIGIIYAFVPLFDTLDTFAWFRAAENAGWVTRAGWEHLSAGFGRPGQYQLGAAYAFMILVILLRPTGLLGKASAKRA